MTFFYDYELGYGRDGSWYLVLCAGGKPLMGGSYCRVSKAGDNCWVRKTCWRGAKGGTRYLSYGSEDEALQAGIRWARRRERADELEDAR